MGKRIIKCNIDQKIKNLNLPPQCWIRWILDRTSTVFAKFARVDHKENWADLGPMSIKNRQHNTTLAFASSLEMKRNKNVTYKFQLRP